MFYPIRAYYHPMKNTTIIPREVALSVCEKIRQENRSRPSGTQALQCRQCQACRGGEAVESGDRPCCLVRQRCARLLATRV
jgi:hypothetical protein